MNESSFIVVVNDDHKSNDGFQMSMGTPMELTRKAIDRLLRYYRKWFRNWNHIFVHKGPFEPLRSIACEFVRYAHFEELPDHVRAAIAHYGGRKILKMDQQEMEQSADIWIAIIDQQLAGVLFTRKGKKFRRWFVEIKDDDMVIFRMRTYPAFRGRGVAPSLMRYAMHHSLQGGHKAYIDCRVYNKPSIRAIQKAGFKQFATMKPIKREEALGGDVV